MKTKMELIREAIQQAIPDSEIVYRENKFVLHKFRIDRSEMPSCWLYLTWEYVEDNSEDQILEKFRKLEVFETLINTDKPRRLAVGDFGVREVDESYGRA